MFTSTKRQKSERISSCSRSHMVPEQEEQQHLCLTCSHIPLGPNAVIGMLGVLVVTMSVLMLASVVLPDASVSVQTVQHPDIIVQR